MAYAGINTVRFEWLLCFGVEDEELQKFFRENRVPLLQAGAKVQNPPHGANERRRMMARGVPQAGDPIIERWFRKTLSVVDPLEPQVIIGAFERAERLGEDLPESTLKELSRSCLFHLFQSDPPKDLLQFLTSPLPGPDKDNLDGPATSQSKGEELPSLAMGGVSQWAFLNVLVSLLRNEDPDQYLVSLPPDLAAFVSGIALVKAGNFEGARQVIAPVSTDHELHVLFDAFLAHERALRDSPGVQGLRVHEAEVFEGQFDVDGDSIVGYCTRANSPSAVFVTPIFVLRDGVAMELTKEVRASLFPDTGDVMAFSGMHHPKQPKRGELGIWKVAEHDTQRPEQRTHFHIVGEKRGVYEVRSVPFSSSDHDAVRGYLQDDAKRQRDGGLQQRLQAPLLFELQDGLLIKMESETVDLTKNEAYEGAFQAWRTLNGFRFEGRRFVFGPLPEATLFYECPPLSISVRRLFGSLRQPGQERAYLTRAQLRQLAESIESRDVALDIERVERIRRGLEQIARHEDALDAIVTTVTAHPDVAKRVDEEVRRLVEEKMVEKKSIQRDIETLSKQKSEWEDRVRKEREQFGKLPEQVSRAIAKAFKDATEDGVRTLANAAVLQSVLGKANLIGDMSTDRTPVERGRERLRSETVSPSSREVAEILKIAGLPSSRAKCLEIGMKAVLNAGLVLCLRGQTARSVSKGIASSLSKHHVMVFDVAIGLIDELSLEEVLKGSEHYDAIVLRDANLSATELYLRPLVDAISEMIAGGDRGNGPMVILSLADGVSALPLDKNLRLLAVTIDLDRRIPQSEESVDDAVLFDPESGVFSHSLWAPAAECLRRVVYALPDADRNDALKVLLASATDSSTSRRI